jgi:protein-S-isoprenylcysteine O-methyltransferase Ste14
VSLFLRSALFTVAVPGSAAVLVPWWILWRHPGAAESKQWVAVVVIAAGALLYLSCVRLFAVLGRGTPGPWDAPRRLVVAGPFRWVRNPLYLGALLVVLGEAWLFLSAWLVAYAAAMAIAFHLFVLAYEEPTLRRRFGDDYARYVRTVPRWVPRRPPAAPEG